jgi:hypothetical protein
VKKPRSPDEMAEFFREQGRKGGRIGGRLSAAARMLKMTPEQRSAVAKKAVTAREAKRRLAAADPAAAARLSKYAAICGLSPDELRRHFEGAIDYSMFCFKRVCLEDADPCRQSAPPLDLRPCAKSYRAAPRLAASASGSTPWCADRSPAF